MFWGFLGGSVVKNPPALQETQVWPPSGKIPHAVEQLNLYAMTIESVLWSLGATTDEARMP